MAGSTGTLISSKALRIWDKNVTRVGSRKNAWSSYSCWAATALVKSVTIRPKSLSWTAKQIKSWNLSSFPSLEHVVSMRVINRVYILLNWLDLDKVAPWGILGDVPKLFFGESNKDDIDNPWPMDRLGDSRVLCPLFIGEAIGEFWLLDEAYKWGKLWLKSMVTFKKKSQTDKLRPKSLADLYP